MRKTNKLYRLFIICVFFNMLNISNVFAAGSKFSYGISTEVGKGSMGNGLADAPQRDMLFIPISLFGGFNIKKVRLGLNYEYLIGNQSTDPINVANTNLSGKGSALGVRLDYYTGIQSIGLVYRLSSDYTPDKQTFAGTSVKYKGSFGYSIQYMRQIKNRWGFIVDYTAEEYKESLTSSPIKWNRIGLGVVFSNFGAVGGGK